MRRELERAAVGWALRATDPLRAARRAAGLARRRLEGRAGRDGPLRVLVEVATLDRGGLEEAVHDLVVRFDRSRVVPTVACVRGGGWVADRLRSQGVPVVDVGERPAAFRDLLRAERSDAVLSHYSTFGSRAARSLAIPDVHVLHNAYTWLDDGGMRRMAWALRRMTRLVAVSSAVARWAQRRLHLPPGRVEVVANGIDPERFALGDRAAVRRARREALGIDEDAAVFLLVGTYEPRKGQRAFLRALERVPASARCVGICAGNSPDPGFFDECRRYVAERGLGHRVRLLPFDESPAGLYCAADAFVLPSVVEGFSLSTLEAAAAGLPLLLTDVGGARDLLGRAPIGVLLPGYLDDLAEAAPRDLERVQAEPPARVVDALAEAMADVCERREAWRAAAGAGPGLVAREFAVEAVARRYEAILEGVAI